MRYVLCSNAPETKDNDFTWKDFQARNNNELVAIFGNFVNRTMVLTQKYFEGKVPPVNRLTEADHILIEEIGKFPSSIGKSLDNYRFREALNEMMNLARLGNKYLADNEPWKLIHDDPERVQNVMNLSLQICANLSILCEPFLPFTAIKLREMLNLPLLKWKDAGMVDLLKAGWQLNKSDFLFEKIEDDIIQQQIQKLLDTKQENSGEFIKLSPVKESINYEAFARMDIRVGTILEACKVPKTKKLLQLKIDTGVDIRTVVSGIAEDYDPENIIGQQVSVLLNLEPRNIKGIESSGMILMAENREGKLCFVSPADPFSNGSEIK